MKETERDAAVLLAHGSRDRAAIEEVERFVLFFQEWSGLKKISLGYLELAAPSISTAIGDAVAAGAKRIWTAPLFIFPGRHVVEDLPRILSEAQEEYPEVKIYAGAPLNLNFKLMALATRRIDPDQDQAVLKKTALLVIGRGTLSPRGIAATENFTKALAALLPYPCAVHCFAEVVPPSIREGVERCIASGATAIVAFPALLFTGVTLRKVEKEIELLREEYPAVTIRLAGHFGIDPLLAEIVLEEIESAQPVGQKDKGSEAAPFDSLESTPCNRKGSIG